VHSALPPPAAPPQPIALRPREAAKALSISERQLWTLTKRGAIPHLRLGRCIVYPIDSLRAWLRHQAEGAVRP